MVPFCNRTLVFLLNSGYRYRTGFRFKISTGEPDGGGRVYGWSQGKIAQGNDTEPFGFPPSLPPSGRSVTYPILCQFILFGKCKHLYETTSIQSLTPYSIQSLNPSTSNLSIHQHPISQSNLSIQSLTPYSIQSLAPYSIQSLTPYPSISHTIFNPISQSNLSHHIHPSLTPHTSISHTTYIQSLAPYSIQSLTPYPSISHRISHRTNILYTSSTFCNTGVPPPP